MCFLGLRGFLLGLGTLSRECCTETGPREEDKKKECVGSAACQACEILLDNKMSTSKEDPGLSVGKAVVVGIACGISVAVVSAAAALKLLKLRLESKAEKNHASTKPQSVQAQLLPPPPPPPSYGAFMQAVGNTKLVELPSLSRITGCRILGKCEFLNPGGSSKDRIAKAILLDAIRKGKLLQSRGGGGESEQSTVVEGTSGSTGISLSLAARALGLQCLVIMPDDISTDKSDLLERFGAKVERVPPASDSSPDHYVNKARAIAAELPKGFFADQFEHPANHVCHYDGTGAEIWKQTNGDVDAFISGSGTGGTIAGVGRYLRERRPEVCICLADPQGSGLANRVNHGILYTREMQESRLRRHRFVASQI